MPKVSNKTSKPNFKCWLKENNIEVYKRTYYWVADDGSADYRQVGGTKSKVMQSLKSEFTNKINLN